MNRYEVGKAIKYYRSTKNIKQTSIARYFNYDRSKISRIEHGISNDDEMYEAMLKYLGGRVSEVEEAEAKLHELIMALGFSVISQTGDISKYKSGYEELRLMYPFIEEFSLTGLLKLMLSGELSSPAKQVGYAAIEDSDHSFTANETAILKLTRACMIGDYDSPEVAVGMLKAISLQGCGPLVKGAVHYYIGKYNYYQEKYSEVFMELDKASGYFSEKNLEVAIINAEMARAVVYANTGDFSKALEQYRLLKTMEGVKNNHKIMDNLNHNLASLYIRMHEYELVIKTVGEMKEPGVPSLFFKAYSYYRLAKPHEALNELKYASSVFEDVNNQNMVAALKHFIIDDEDTEAYLVDLNESFVNEHHDVRKAMCLEMLADYYKEKSKQKEEKRYKDELKSIFGKSYSKM